MWVEFDKQNVFRFDSATEFLQWYAETNAETLLPPLVTVEGARALLIMRALTLSNVILDNNLDDEAFVRSASEAGLFGIWVVDDLENPSQM